MRLPHKRIEHRAADRILEAHVCGYYRRQQVTERRRHPVVVEGRTPSVATGVAASGSFTASGRGFTTSRVAPRRDTVRRRPGDEVVEAPGT